MLSVSNKPLILSVIMLNVVMLSVVILNVVAPFWQSGPFQGTDLACNKYGQIYSQIYYVIDPMGPAL
jgi:hypothetical protein